MIVPDSVWRDRKHPQRRLVIEQVRPRDQAGREVVGVLRYPGDPTNGRQYATDLATFEKVWELTDA